MTPRRPITRTPLALLLLLPAACAYDPYFDAPTDYPHARAVAPFLFEDEPSSPSRSASRSDPSSPSPRPVSADLRDAWTNAWSPKQERTLVASSDFLTSKTIAGTSVPLRNGAIALPDCVLFGLEHSLDVKIAAFDRSATGENISIARGEFQPQLSGSVGRESDRIAEESILAGERIAENFDEAEGRLEKKFSTGTIVAAEVRSASDNRSGSSVGGFDPTTPLAKSDATVRLRQPLLKGGSIKANRAGIELAKLSVARSDILLRAQVLEFLRGSETGYWLAAIGKELYRARQESLERSLKILEDVRALYEVGNASNLDVLEADAAVAKARETMVSSRKQFEDAVDNLWFILGLPPGIDSAGLKFESIEAYPFPEETPDAEESFRRAMSSYPDVLLLGNEVKNRQQRVIRAKNDRLPELDLDLSGRTALSGDAFDNVRDGEYDWSALLRFSIPWTMKAERAQLRQAKVELDRSKIAREQGERRLYRDILAASRDIDFSAQQLETAVHSADVNARKFEEQRRRYQEGLVSVRDLMEDEEASSLADAIELEARLRLIAAHTLLQQIDGSILQRHGLKW